MNKSCPGSRAIKEAAPSYMVCPHCQNEVEIWTDEYRVRCGRCKAWVFRTQGATCLDWCAKAQECVGAQALAAYQQAKKRPE